LADTDSKNTPERHRQTRPLNSTCRKHLRFGWWSLFCFVTIGLLLEALHGFKVPWYLDPAFKTRRLVWTLGHAHGTLLALVHIAFALSVHITEVSETRSLRLASVCLIAASIFLPGGFLLGGIFLYSGDPGLGIALVPLGAICLMAGCLVTSLRHLK